MRNNAGRVWVWLLVVFILLPIAGFAAWTWASLSFSYASGDRAGYVQKISNKGWLCKTWEGELAMANLPGSMPQIFAFSVRDPKVAENISKTIGQRVSLHYEQHRGVPTNCFGETEYYVTRVLPAVEPAGASQGPQAPASTPPAGQPAAAVPKG